MLLVSIVLIFLFLTVVADNIFEKSILYPPFIFNLIWFMVIFIYFIYKIFDPDEMDTLHSNTLIFIAVSNFFFSLGGFYVLTNLKKKSLDIFFKPTKVPEIVGDIVIMVTLLSLVLLFFKAKEYASEIQANNFFISLRFQLTNMRISYGILEYFMVFGLFASLYRLYTFNDFSDLRTKEKLKLILSILISFAFLALSTARTSFFLYFITFLMTIYLKGKIRRKYIWSFFIASILSFLIVGVVLNKGGSLTDSLGENIRSGINHFLAYFEGPVLAFDRFLNSDFIHTYGKNTFRFFFALLYKLGIIETQPLDIVKEWILVPYPTNVYTVFYPYIMDFGIVACWVIIFLFGLVHTWLFYRSKTSGNHFKMITAYSYYPLLMVFFQDQYFSLLSQWIQMWFYSFLILCLFGYYKHKKIHVT